MNDKAKLYIHRDLAGKHVLNGDWCWCNPLIVDEDDERTTDALVEAAKVPTN